MKYTHRNTKSTTQCLDGVIAMNNFTQIDSMTQTAVDGVSRDNVQMSC